MRSAFSHRRLAWAWLLMPLLGCGATATLPPSASNQPLAAEMAESVWYAELGQSEGLAQATTSPDGVDFGWGEPSILVEPPQDGSQYVHGVFALSVPEQAGVSFRTGVALADSGPGEVSVQVYAQEGSAFPLLAERTIGADATLDPIDVDLTPYRGREILLILSTSGVGAKALDHRVLWLAPTLVLP